MSLSDIRLQTSDVELMYRFLGPKIGMGGQVRLKRVFGSDYQPTFVHRKKRHHDVVLTDFFKVKMQFLSRFQQIHFCHFFMIIKLCQAAFLQGFSHFLLSCRIGGLQYYSHRFHFFLRVGSNMAPALWCRSVATFTTDAPQLSTPATKAVQRYCQSTQPNCVKQILTVMFC